MNRLANSTRIYNRNATRTFSFLRRDVLFTYKNALIVPVAENQFSTFLLVSSSFHLLLFPRGVVADPISSGDPDIGTVKAARVILNLFRVGLPPFLRFPSSILLLSLVAGLLVHKSIRSGFWVTIGILSSS